MDLIKMKITTLILVFLLSSNAMIAKEIQEGAIEMIRSEFSFFNKISLLQSNRKDHNPHLMSSITTSSIYTTDLEFHSEYVYNNNTLKIIEKRIIEQKDDFYYLSDREFYVYDEQGQLNKVVYEDINGNDTVQVKKEIYEYYEDGNQKSVLVQKIIKGEWINTKSIEFVRTNNKEIETEFEWINGESLNKIRHDRFFQDDTIRTEINSKWIDGKWINDTKLTFTYESFIHYIEIEYFDEDVWDLRYRSIFYYDTRSILNAKYLMKKEIAGGEINWLNWMKLELEYGIGDELFRWKILQWNGKEYENVGSNRFEIEDYIGNKLIYSSESDNPIISALIFWEILKPGDVELIEPQNQSSKVSINPTFSWTTPMNGFRFDVLIAKNDFFNSGLIELKCVSWEDLKIPTLENKQKYYWKVRASNPNSSGPWSEVWSFRTIALAPQTAASLILPTNGAKEVKVKSTELIWNSVEGAEGYTLTVTVDGNVEHNFTDLTGTNKVIDLELYETEYSWTVQAWNEGGEGPVSETWEFTTEKFVSVEELISKYEVSASPNPTSDKAIISYSLPHSVQISIKIYDEFGNTIQTLKEQKQATGEHQYEFNTGNLSSGVYYYSIQFGSEQVNGKIVKVK
jgi:type IX secretion system substrate protein